MAKVMDYEKTHPWLAFSCDVRRFSHSLWMNLGEARSKCEHLSGVPLRPKTQQELNAVYLAKGIAATTAIEGNTLSEEQVRKRIEGTLVLPKSQEYMGKEIDNILAACNEEVAKVFTQAVPVSIDLINGFNRRVLDGLSVEEDVLPGQLRRHSVGVARYLAPRADDCPKLMQRLIDWLNSDDFKADEVFGLAKPLMGAVIAHLYLAWIHPYGDGNGRTARLLEMFILVSAGIPSPAAHLFSNHYNKTRGEYYRQLDAASKSKDIVHFIEYAIAGFVDGIQEQIEIVQADQLDIAWRNYVHERFRESSEVGKRQRELCLELGRMKTPVAVNMLDGLSSRQWSDYGSKTSKTLIRDIKKLVEMQLVVVEEGFVRANFQLMQGFLPRHNSGRAHRAV